MTNTGPSTINGNLGLHPGTAVTGFPPGTVNGTTHAANAAALQAQSDLTIAYNDAAGRTPATTAPADLGGLTLAPGVYRSASSIGLTGTLTLDAQGDPNAVFVFQAGSTLITASASRVRLVNGAQACNVFWQVGSSATLGTSTVLAGNILALTSITMNDGVTLNGRALARNGAVTLINDTITAAHCAGASWTSPARCPPLRASAPTRACGRTMPSSRRSSTAGVDPTRATWTKATWSKRAGAGDLEQATWSRSSWRPARPGSPRRGRARRGRVPTCAIGGRRQADQLELEQLALEPELVVEPSGTVSRGRTDWRATLIRQAARPM